MKKVIIVMSLILMGLSCKAQCIVPLEDIYNYGNSDYLEDNDCYLKDVNNVLGKYVGTWRAVFDGKTMDVFITRYTDDSKSSFDIKIDLLLLRYKITDSNNVILMDTTSLPYDSKYVCQGVYLNRTGTYYSFTYTGEDPKCGQSGNLFIRINNDPNSLKLHLSPDTSWVGSEHCPGEEAEQLLPIGGETVVIFTKQ